MTKRKIIPLLLLLVLAFTPLFADPGLNFDFSSGATSSLVRVYISEKINMSYIWDWNGGLGLGVKFMQPILKSSNESESFYYIPYATFIYNSWYIGGGVLPNLQNEDNPLSIYALLGYSNHFISAGPGKFGLDAGIELSPTFYKTNNSGDSDEQLGNAIAAVFTTLINILKLYVHVSYSIPY